MSIAERGEALPSPNVKYRTDLEPDLIECVTGLLENVIAKGGVNNFATCSQEGLSRWYEVETLSLGDLHIRRLFLRQDVIFSGPDASDTWRIIIEDGVIGDRDEDYIRKSILLFVPEDEPAEYALATQVYVPNPLFGNSIFENMNLPTSEQAKKDIVLIGRIATHDFYTLNRMTERDLEDLFDMIAFIDNALQRGDDMI